MTAVGLPSLLAAVSGSGTLPPQMGRHNCIRDDGDAWLSYADVVRKAGSLANTLRGHAGGLAILALRNDADSVLALLAAWSAGVAAALIDPGIDTGARERIIAAFRPELLYDPERGFASTGLKGETVTPGTGILLSTSGTTGTTKFVRLQNTALFANAEQIAQVLHIGPESVAVCHLPLHYSYGLSVLLSHLQRGAAAFITDSEIISPDFSARIAAAGGTHFPGVPYHYTVLNHFGLDRRMPPSVTTFTQAGGYLDMKIRTAIYQQVQARGGRFYVMYGQTEAAPRISTLSSEMFPRKPDSVGAALPGGRIEIVGDDGSILPIGEIGQVVYRGPNVMWGYASERADLSLGDKMNGRLETGDLGRLDAEGILFIIGRNSRFAKVAGLRIGLDEVERRLRPEFEIVLLPGDESVLVFHDAKQNSEVLRGRFSALAKEYRIPARSFVLKQINSIPRLASGKIDFSRLREAT